VLADPDLGKCLAEAALLEIPDAQHAAGKAATRGVKDRDGHDDHRPAGRVVMQPRTHHGAQAAGTLKVGLLAHVLT